MDKHRIRQAGQDKRSTDSRREKLRIIVYALVAVTIVVYLALGDGDHQPEVQVPSERTELPRDYVPTAKVDPARLTSVRDDTETARAVLEPDPLQHLVEQASKLVYGDLAQLGVRTVGRDELLANTAEWRGKPVSVLGTLQWFEPDSFTDPDSFRGEILDVDGQPWLFQIVSLPWEIAVGDVVRLGGFFLKHHDMLRPDRSFADGPLIVGEELLPSAFRIDPVTELTPEMFRGVRDYDMTEASRPLDGLPFFQLLSYVQNVPADEIHGPVEDCEPMYATELLVNQDEWRGKPVTVVGNLLYVQRRLLGPEGENPLGSPYVWDMWMHNRTGGVTHVVLLDEPVGLVGNQDMAVEVDGVFFRREIYENKFNQVKVASVLVGSRAREFIIPPDTLTPWLQRIIVGIGLLLLVLITVAQLREGKLLARARVRSVGRKKKLIALPGTLQGLGRRGAAHKAEVSAAAASATEAAATGDDTPDTGTHDSDTGSSTGPATGPGAAGPGDAGAPART